MPLVGLTEPESDFEVDFVTAVVAENELVKGLLACFATDVVGENDPVNVVVKVCPPPTTIIAA
jgi:hypothetical protein